MDLLNVTGMTADYTMGMKPDGWEYLLEVVKGKPNIRLDGSTTRLRGGHVDFK